MTLPMINQHKIHEDLMHFINQDVLSSLNIDANEYWQEVVAIISQLTPQNQALLDRRQALQTSINQYFKENAGAVNTSAYKEFLSTTGYIAEEEGDFIITPANIDAEISDVSAPQLVVPVDNARFAINAANARWGSLYDALYGTDAIPHTTGLKPGKEYNPARGKKVIRYVRNFLDETFPLNHGSHKHVSSYGLYYQHLVAYFSDGTCTGLADPSQYVAYSGSSDAPSALLLKNNGLHVELVINHAGKIGAQDLAGLDDVRIESALTTIIDFEDSVAAVDADDKIAAYRNWLGLIRGDLKASFTKQGEQIDREMSADFSYSGKDDCEYKVKGKSLLLVRNVGHLMTTSLMLNECGQECFEGIIDSIITATIASLDIVHGKNSQRGSIYIVKPKMHGPEEVAFTCDLFARIEKLLGLPEHTIKLGIMDEERRTTVNLKACIRVAKERIFFINTGFLDRTGDEIHTCMEAGPVLPKDEIKQQPWIAAYEQNNVDIGLQTGFRGRAQIGKGMWAMPDEMAQMITDKLAHPLAGADTAWVPSPTAATLHALHYHAVNVDAVQAKLMSREPANLDDILTAPLLNRALTEQEVEHELANNIQGILGYMVRWIDLGIGCSKVPDINDVGLMEDRATLRISSQHISNWLKHGICTPAQVDQQMQRMAQIVDQQNINTPGYQPMAVNFETNTAFQAARTLIYKGCEQPSGYTEPVLHQHRLAMK